VTQISQNVNCNKFNFIVKDAFCSRWSLVSDIYVSQGSVATHLRCGGIFSNHYITGLLLSLWCNNFENQSTFGEVMGKSSVLLTDLVVNLI